MYVSTATPEMPERVGHSTVYGPSKAGLNFINEKYYVATTPLNRGCPLRGNDRPSLRNFDMKIL